MPFLVFHRHEAVELLTFLFILTLFCVSNKLSMVHLICIYIIQHLKAHFLLRSGDSLDVFMLRALKIRLECWNVGFYYRLGGNNFHGFMLRNKIYAKIHTKIYICNRSRSGENLQFFNIMQKTHTFLADCSIFFTIQGYKTIIE